MQQLVHNQINRLSVILTTTGGLPATGVLFSSVTCQLSKDGGVFAPKTLTISNFIEVGLGYYLIEFTASECDTLGLFLAVVTGAGLSQSTTPAQVMPASSVSTAATVQTCAITGHINDLDGAPMQDVVVSARILGQPTLINTGIVGIGLGDDLVSAKTDVNGFFSINLARLVMVDVFITAIGYRRTLTVPNVASADLFTQVP